MFQAFLATSRALYRLLRELRPSGPRVAVTIVLMMLAGVVEGATVGMLVPLLTMLTGAEVPATAGIRWVLPFLDALERTQQVLALAGCILVLVACKNTLAHLGLISAGKIRSAANVELRRRLLEAVLHAPPATLEKYTSGEIAGAFLSEAMRVNRALDYSIALLQRLIMVGGYFAALVFLSWRLMLVALALGVVLAALTLLLSRKTLHVGRDVAGANAALGRQVTEMVGGLRVVRVTASEEAQKASFERWNRSQAEAEVAGSISQSVMQGTTETLGVAGAMCLTALAYTSMLGDGALNVSRFLAFSFGLLRLLPALNQVYGMQASLASHTGSIEKTLRWLDLPRYPRRAFGTRRLNEIREGVTFQDLSFSYPDGHQAVRSVSFHVPAGRTVALLGASGSGKSTLASLLARLREPESGAILFDGVDHWEFEPSSFHRAVAFVEQDPFLFNLTIAENVGFGMQSVTREEVLAAVHSVQLSDLIDRLPNGIDTVVGERGATISGGQRQRLAIARAIVRDPRLLILDEPTSALDAETEREVVRAIDAASVGRTTLIITHRPSTVAHAHQVLRIANGRLEAVGDAERDAVAASRGA